MRVPGRPCLSLRLYLLVGSLAGSGGGGCSRHLRRRPPGGAEMWPLVAALLLGSCCCGEWLGGSRLSSWGAAPGRPRRSVGLHPRRPGGARKRAERRRERVAGCAGPAHPERHCGRAPRGIGAPASSLCSPSRVPFPPGESGLKLLTLQCAHVGRLETTATVQSRTAKKARGAAAREPLFSHPSPYLVFSRSIWG